jgi:hypothetical protein
MNERNGHKRKAEAGLKRLGTPERYGGGRQLSLFLTDRLKFILLPLRGSSDTRRRIQDKMNLNLFKEN